MMSVAASPYFSSFNTENAKDLCNLCGKVLLKAENMER